MTAKIIKCIKYHFLIRMMIVDGSSEVGGHHRLSNTL